MNFKNKATCTIGIFAREPIAGHTKTRLIPLLGAEGAAQFHRQCIAATAQTAQQAALGDVVFFVTPALKEDSFFYSVALSQGSMSYVEQTGKDLGERMHNAFEQGLKLAQRMIIIGTDCPVLSVQHLRNVDAWLQKNEGACFIPAEDGGYVLVGLSAPHAALFYGIDWGTAQVMAQTRAAAKIVGINLHEMPPLWDIDTPSDYKRLAEDALISGVFKAS